MKDESQNSRRSICFRAIIVIAVVGCGFIAARAGAHEASKSYLELRMESGRVSGRWEIPVRDLQGVMPGKEIGAHYREAAGYAMSQLQIAVDGRAVVPVLMETGGTTEEFSDGEYLRLNFNVDAGAVPETVDLNYGLFFDTNSLARGLVRVEGDGKTQVTAFSPEHRRQQFQIARSDAGREFFTFLREGIWHIWTGFDHILFLLALLLPSVLRREEGRWQAVGELRPVFYNVLKIVTAFTVAHSITLSLATLGVVSIPSRITESAIAISVALAALNNLWPLIRERGWMVAFGFGLVHGFGFATALSDMGLGHGALALTLTGFNVGVEIGQLAIVAIFVPVAFALRRTWVYQIPMMRLGSACIILLAGGWCAERVMNVKLMPF